LGRSGNPLPNPLMTDAQFLREGAQLLIVAHAPGEQLPIEWVRRAPGHLNQLNQLYAVGLLRGCESRERIVFRIRRIRSSKPVWVHHAFAGEILMQRSPDADICERYKLKSARWVEMSRSPVQSENRLGLEFILKEGISSSELFGQSQRQTPATLDQNIDLGRGHGSNQQ
jgi:hypothetical protein